MKKGERVSNKTNKADKNKPKRDSLWWALRVSFLGMVGLFFSPFILRLWSTPYLIPFFSVYFFGCWFALCSLIFSIVNLVKKRSNLLSFVALMSSIIVLFVFVSVTIVALVMYNSS